MEHAEVGESELINNDHGKMDASSGQGSSKGSTSGSTPRAVYQYGPRRGSLHVAKPALQVAEAAHGLRRQRRPQYAHAARLLVTKVEPPFTSSGNLKQLGQSESAQTYLVIPVVIEFAMSTRKDCGCTVVFASDAE